MPLTDKEKKDYLIKYQAAVNLARMSLFESEAKTVSGGNVAVLEVFNDETRVFSDKAFSNSSGLPKNLKANLAPSVPKTELGDLGIPKGQQHANHTEPKLWKKFDLHKASKSDFNKIILISEMDCCKSCLKTTISELSGVTDLVALKGKNIEFIVIELNSKKVSYAHDLVDKLY
ncbi:hypothetical protein NBRC116602_00520 [Hyphomicrobiales bacterium 4NK60-0047b]